MSNKVDVTPWFFDTWHTGGPATDEPIGSGWFKFYRRVNGQRIGRLVTFQQAAASTDLLAICEKLAERGAVIATTGLGDELAAAIASAKGGAQ